MADMPQWIFEQITDELSDPDLPPEEAQALAEIALCQWGQTPEQVAAEKKRLAKVRRANTIAKKNMPQSRRHPDNFRVSPVEAPV